MRKKVINFKKYSSIKIGPVIEINIIENENELDIEGILIGGANNLLISPMPPPLKMLGKEFDFIKIEDSILRVGCATKSGRLLSFARKNNIGSLEFIAKLPGTIGGMIAMNAGVKDREIFNIIKRVKINKKWIDKKDIKFGYRFAKLNGVATQVELDLKKGFNEKLMQELISLRSNQPKKPSAGSCFKNPKKDFAGRLIEAVGLKGKRVGDMAFSQIHANFLVNLKEGRFEDAITLINLAKTKVKEQFNIILEEEIKII